MTVEFIIGSRSMIMDTASIELISGSYTLTVTLTGLSGIIAGTGVWYINFQLDARLSGCCCVFDELHKRVDSVGLALYSVLSMGARSNQA